MLLEAQHVVTQLVYVFAELYILEMLLKPSTYKHKSTKCLTFP